jgi:hypothetical protein
MEKKRRIEKAGGKVTFTEGEDESLLYWANLTVKERLIEAQQWNKRVWQYLLKDKYPQKIELTGGKQTKALTDEDDF